MAMQWYGTVDYITFNTSHNRRDQIILRQLSLRIRIKQHVEAWKQRGFDNYVHSGWIMRMLYMNVAQEYKVITLRCAFIDNFDDNCTC